MPRIYKQEEYGQLFEPAAKSQSYNPVAAYDSSAAIKQRAADQIETIRSFARSAARQAELDQSALDVQRITNSANFANMRGLLSLSQTGMQFYQDVQKQQAQRAQEDELLNAIGWGETKVEATPQAKAQDAQTEAAITAEAQGTAAVAAEFKQQPDLNSQSAAHVLQETTTFNLTKETKGNAYNAMASHGLFLSEALRTLPPERMPNTAAEAQVLMRELNRQFLRESGMMGADRESVLKLANTMVGNTQNAMVSLMSTAIKTKQEQNLVAVMSTISDLVDTDSSPDQIWKEASKLYAFGNVGYTGFSSASNIAAIENVLQEAAENGNSALIAKMREVEMVPGNKGTKLGKLFDNVFDKYEKAARTEAIQSYNLRQAESQVQMKQSLEFFYNDPSPANRQKAVAILRGLGTEEALKEAERLAQYGLNYDPQKKFELYELKAKGQQIPEDVLKQLLDDGTISPEEYKQFSTSSTTKAALKQIDDYLKTIKSGLKNSMQGTAGPQDLNAETKAELEIRHGMMMEELRAMLESEVRVNPSLANQPAELARLAEAKTKQLLQRPEYKLQTSPGKGYHFAGEISTDQRLARVTVAPGVQDFSKFKAEDIFGKLKVPKSEMNPTVDRFLTLDQLKADVRRVLKGDNPSNNTRLIAKNLGMSSSAFLEAQLGVNGLPGLQALRSGENPQQLLNQLRNIPNASEGFKYLKSLGFPTKGAAYLAGNIQQESGWHGLREWGQVAGDGTNRNGGLVSWASWANDSARLGRIERHFGKNIAQIPESDQLAYMVMEMRTRYPDAYRVFMNPNASDADLQRASYRFWGYGHEGARFSYARSLLKYGRI